MDPLSHRKAVCRLLIKDAAGIPVAGRKIRAGMVRHRFLFGCGAFDTLPLLDDNTPKEQKAHLQILLDAWLELFNFGTLPFYWGRYEPEEGKPNQAGMERAARWLAERKVVLKGHPLCWHTQTAKWLLSKTEEDILACQLNRIQRDVAAFSGLVDMWDVINEAVIMPIFDKEENGITRLCKKMGRAELIRRVFEAARMANPKALLILNDFNTSDSYQILAECCLAMGIPIGAIGIQSHQHQGFWGLEKLERILERFETLKLPIHFTENTLISGELMPAHIEDLNDYQVSMWPTTPAGEDRQARDMLAMADFLFARPGVEAFTPWCIVDGRWLHAPAGLLREDGSKKPAFYALKERIKRDWWTDVTLYTDENGCAELSGFMGDYSLSMGAGRAEFSLRPGLEEQTVTLA